MFQDIHKNNFIELLIRKWPGKLGEIMDGINSRECNMIDVHVIRKDD